MLTTWQGRPGARICLVWCQGHALAAGDALDGEPAYGCLSGSPLRLPPEFRIHSYNCLRLHPIQATCECVDDVSTRMTLMPFEPLEVVR